MKKTKRQIWPDTNTGLFTVIQITILQKGTTIAPIQV